MGVQRSQYLSIWRQFIQLNYLIEEKIESCRATRDLRSCERNGGVLRSCTHAPLCDISIEIGGMASSCPFQMDCFDERWRDIIDDFAATFCVLWYSVLESYVYFLLDDHTDEGLQEASHLLPEISSVSVHPKVALVLL
ncbi:unnamed protein product [Cuscuta epithymum]|uniref:Uncharacterized protein n=1 Tax=Cuscuta epithymum TaxID=186058 RepID=A0AAV0CGY2_9ASTE|nr:unnamed protein product [Cuscuta epithymum]